MRRIVGRGRGGARALLRCGGAAQLIAFLATDARIALAAPLVPAFWLALSLGAGVRLGHAAGVAPRHIGLCAAAGLYLVQLGSELLGGYAMPLSAGVLSLSALPVASAVLFGVGAPDALLLALASAALAGSARMALFPLTAQAAGALALYGYHGPATPLAESEASQAPRTGLQVHAIQPVTPTEDQRAMGWSLSSRAAIEQRLSRLTAEALGREPGLVVWPEAASGLHDLQLPRRREQLAGLLRGSRSELLASSYVTTARGKYNAVGLYTAAGLDAVTTKQKLVPLAEAELRAGPLRVLESRAGVVGVLVCFDSLFPGLARRIARQGAQLLVVTTDDGSFGRSSAGYAHVAFTIVSALSLGLPLVIASNAGPSLAGLADGRVVASLPYGERGVLSAKLEPGPGPHPMQRPLQLVLAAALLVTAACAAWRRPEAGALAPGRPAPIAVSTLPVAVALLAVAPGVGLGLELFSHSVRDGDGPARVVSDVERRRLGPGVMDALAPPFRQQSADSCGAAALAFAPTSLGAELSEGVVKRRCSLQGMSSMDELEQCARRLGFVAHGIEADYQGLLARVRAPALLHLRDPHYAVLLHVGPREAVVFDPAVGRQLVLRAELQARWSGGLLALGYAPPFEVDQRAALE